MNQLMFQQHHKLWVILPAAGSGSRFSKTELNQYQMIQERTVLEHTVSRLIQLPLAGYVLAIGAQDDVAKTLPLSRLECAEPRLPILGLYQPEALKDVLPS